MKDIIFAFSLLLIYGVSIGQEMASTLEGYRSDDIDNTDVNNFIYYRPQNVFEDPFLLVTSFSSEAIPLEYYSQEDIALQKELNSKEERIVTLSSGEERFYSRDVDRDEITPFTWKWVHLQFEEEEGFANVHLRRPNWWFVENNATAIGDNLDLRIPEIGLDKRVRVVAIYPNQLDTRLWDIETNGETVVRPITGKIEHHANNVVSLYFEGEEDALSVTTNHLLWSQDRDDWVAVKDLSIGENLKTKKGVVRLSERMQLPGSRIVYDLEVYRDHNFLVGAQNVLAHNGCPIPQVGKRKHGYFVGTIKKGFQDAAKFFGLSKSKMGNFVEALKNNSKEAIENISDQFEVIMKNGKIAEVRMGNKRFRNFKDKNVGDKTVKGGNLDVKNDNIGSWDDVTSQTRGNKDIRDNFGTQGIDIEE